MNKKKASRRDKFKLSVQRWFVRQLIRFKYIKHSFYTERQLNKMLSIHFPQTIKIPYKGSDAKLTIMNAELSLPLDENKIDLQMYCSFLVRVKSIDTYRAHIIISSQVTPVYDQEEKAIRLNDVRLNDIRLVDDDYAFIRSTKDLISELMPLGMGGIFSMTVSTTLSVLKGILPSEIVNYLNLYTSGSKQKVLDYHKPEIEQMITKKIEKENWLYRLDETDFEQKMFSELGREIYVKDGKLIFRFH